MHEVELQVNFLAKMPKQKEFSKKKIKSAEEICESSE